MPVTELSKVHVNYLAKNNLYSGIHRVTSEKALYNFTF